MLVPLVTTEQDTPDRKAWPKPSDPKVVFSSNQIRTAAELKSKMAQPRIRARVVNSVFLRDKVRGAERTLLSHYPQLDIQNCIILEEGHREPLSRNAFFVMMGLTTTCFIVGLSLIGMRLFRTHGQLFLTR